MLDTAHMESGVSSSLGNIHKNKTTGLTGDESCYFKPVTQSEVSLHFWHDHSSDNQERSTYLINFIADRVKILSLTKYVPKRKIAKQQHLYVSSLAVAHPRFPWQVTGHPTGRGVLGHFEPFYQKKPVKMKKIRPIKVPTTLTPTDVQACMPWIK